MAYKGSDLGCDFKSFYSKEKRKISKILTKLGCTNIALDYGFYYYYGFFTSKSGQPYYLSCSDIRYFGYTQILYRTVKNYKDYTGGSNHYIEPTKLKEISLM